MPKVTLARAYKDAKGRKHKADATVDLPNDEAANLLYLGHARQPAKAEKAEQPEQTNTERKN